MKQRIVADQLIELPRKAQEKLREWWKPVFGDHYLAWDGSTLLEQRMVGDYSDREFNENWWNRDEHSEKFCLPLLSIGQMIEIVDSDPQNTRWILCVGNVKKFPMIGEGGGYTLLRGNPGEFITGKTAYAGEVCDLLWGVVKTILIFQ